VLETLRHLQRLSTAGVGYKSLTEQYLDSCEIFKDAVLSILATIAKQEHIRMSERVHAGLALARKEGRIGGRPRITIDRAQIAKLEDEGLTSAEIGAQFGISASSVCRILKAYRPMTPARAV
jgi:DNA invertase Pin-like site-specific DNA recombinase